MTDPLPIVFTTKQATTTKPTSKLDQLTPNAPAFSKDNSNNNNNGQSGGAHVDLTAVVVCITIVVIVAIVACAVVVLRSRIRKRGEVVAFDEIGDSNAFLVEGTVEAVVDDTTGSFDIEGEQQTE